MHSIPEEITVGSIVDRNFIVDNTYHSSEYGDIHYSSYFPDTYDGNKSYSLFITMPGWEGLYFQGLGANLTEDYPFEAIKYNDQMIVISTQLDDWGETSANMVIALTEYFIDHYNIDEDRIYLHGYSGGGETGSIVMGKRPDLYHSYLMTSSKWDGDLYTLAESETPVYMVTGENDSYYGSQVLKKAYSDLKEIYLKQGLSEEEINEILILDIKDQDYFKQRGYSDQHMGGLVFAKDETIMTWLFDDLH